MHNIISDVKNLKLPLGKYSVVGGSALAGRGIREYNDIDLIFTEDLYDRLRNGEWEEKEKHNNFYHIYKGNAEAAKDFSHIRGCKLTTEGVIKNSDIIDGVPFMGLNDLIDLKKTMAREKDFKDIDSINKYLAGFQ